MKLGFICLNLPGHLNPMTALARHLQHRNPPGRGRLAVLPRCSLLTYQSTYARGSRLEKQPTDLRPYASYI
jgi:hypothetical protein